MARTTTSTSFHGPSRQDGAWTTSTRCRWLHMERLTKISRTWTLLLWRCGTFSCRKRRLESRSKQSSSDFDKATRQVTASHYERIIATSQADIKSRILRHGTSATAQSSAPHPKGAASGSSSSSSTWTRPTPDEPKPPWSMRRSSSSHQRHDNDAYNQQQSNDAPWQRNDNRNNSGWQWRGQQILEFAGSWLELEQRWME